MRRRVLFSRRSAGASAPWIISKAFTLQSQGAGGRLPISKEISLETRTGGSDDASDRERRRLFRAACGRHRRHVRTGAGAGPRPRPRPARAWRSSPAAANGSSGSPATHPAPTASSATWRPRTTFIRLRCRCSANSGGSTCCQQRVGSRSCPAGAAWRHRVRGSRARARHERARAISPDQGAAGRAVGVGARKGRRGGPERLERRRNQRLSSVGRLQRQQGGASSSDVGSGTRNSHPKACACSRSIRATWTRRCTRWRCRMPIPRR